MSVSHHYFISLVALIKTHTHTQSFIYLLANNYDLFFRQIEFSGFVHLSFEFKDFAVTLQRYIAQSALLFYSYPNVISQKRYPY